MRRLFPVVHPDDPEREEEYQRLMRDELVTSRLAGIDAVGGGPRAAGRKVTLDEAELLAFMQAVNGVRLVLGTVLDVARTTTELADELVDVAEYQLYGYLSWILDAVGAGAMLAGTSSVRLSLAGRWNVPRGALLMSRCSQLDEVLPPSSSGLGHHPFKVAARVRIPLGVRTVRT